MCDKETPDECKSNGCVWLLDTKKCVSDVKTEKSERKKASDTARGMFGAAMVLGIVSMVLCVLHEKEASEVRKHIDAIRKESGEIFEREKKRIIDLYKSIREEKIAKLGNKITQKDLAQLDFDQAISIHDQYLVIYHKESRLIRKDLTKHNMTIKRIVLWLLFSFSLMFLALGFHFSGIPGEYNRHPGMVNPFIGSVFLFALTSISLLFLMPATAAGIYACVIVALIIMIVFSGPPEVKYETSDTSDTSTDSQQTQ